MDPGWSPVFNHDHHQTILTILKALNRPLLEETSAYFGGGTLLALKFNEYRWSQDIDILCPIQQGGYRSLRKAVFDHGYKALFPGEIPFTLPRDIQADQYGIRLPIAVNGHNIKFEIIAEARIILDPPDYPAWIPVPCLSLNDCFAEKLMANADRFFDSGIRSRDLIDLAILRVHAPVPEEAIQKAENAYPVIQPLIKALADFQARPDYRKKCFEDLQIINPATVIDGIDLLAADFTMTPTERTLDEGKDLAGPRF
ncbi:MAG: nucleotidyl transferase AbiEii/AbiGii toxin family protein [Syntrophotalea acetylenica]|nr:nucleotidyl transferase AbiEii/AbiGii toxin family protein [Syntrophotalea acetylenica]